MQGDRNERKASSAHIYIRAADDIAYKTADIEDAFIKGFLSYHQLKEELAALEKEESAVSFMHWKN